MTHAAAGVADILVALFVVLLAAKLGDELFKRLGQPALVGEIYSRHVVGWQFAGHTRTTPVLA